MLDVVRSDPDLSTFVTLVEAAGLVDVFGCAGPFTVLVPTNAAFDALGRDVVAAWLDPADLTFLQALIYYHVLPGSFPLSSLRAGAQDTLLSNKFVSIRRNPVMFDDASLVIADIPGCNGIFHVISSVLDPTAGISTGVPTTAPSAFIVLTSSTFPTYESGSPSPQPVANLATAAPTKAPTRKPAVAPTKRPSAAPSRRPRVAPTRHPSRAPSRRPSAAPSHHPSAAPMRHPTAAPSHKPSEAPTTQPSAAPSPLRATSSPSAAPTVGTTASPTKSTIQVVVPRFYIAYVSASAVAPTPAQYDALRLATVAYYQDYFTTKLLANPLVNFLSVDFVAGPTMVSAGIPETRFNIYTEYSSAVVTLSPSQSNPGAASLFELLRSGITTDYLLDPVRLLVGTPFADVTEAFLNAAL